MTQTPEKLRSDKDACSDATPSPTKVFDSITHSTPSNKVIILSHAQITKILKESKSIYAVEAERHLNEKVF